MKKIYSVPTLKVHNLKPTHMICNSTLEAATSSTAEDAASDGWTYNVRSFDDNLQGVDEGGSDVFSSKW